MGFFPSVCIDGGCGCREREIMIYSWSCQPCMSKYRLINPYTKLWGACHVAYVLFFVFLRKHAMFMLKRQSEMISLLDT